MCKRFCATKKRGSKFLSKNFSYKLGSTSKIGARAVSKIIKKAYNQFTTNILEGLLMPIEIILTNNANIKITGVTQAKKIIIDCKDETEYTCPKCGSCHLRCKDTFIRNIKNISIGGRASIL